MSVSVSTTAGTTISVSVSGSTQVSFATTTNSVSVTQPASSSISVLGKGTKGDTGATGATGADGRSYAISCVDGDNSDEEKIRLSDSAGVNDDVVLEAGTGLSIARSGDKITFTNTVTDTDTVLSAEQVQDIVGAMFSGNTETRISVTYEDSDGTIDLVVEDMTADTPLSPAQVQDIVGAMFSGNTETRSSATYEDSDGTIDLVVDAIPVDLTSDGAGTIHANNVPTLNQSTTGNAATATALATARAINGVNFDGTAAITVTAAGSTLSDTVPVSKGGTGATTLTGNGVLTGNGTAAITSESNLAFDGNTLTITGQRKIPSTTGSGQFYGDTVQFGSGPNGIDGDIEQGKLYYLDSSQQWEETNANAAASATGMIALAIVDDSARFLVKGLARHSSFAGFTTGDVLYVSGTAAGITKTAPTGSTDIVRIVGYCTDGGNREIYFDPSKDWVELS